MIVFEMRNLDGKPCELARGFYFFLRIIRQVFIETGVSLYYNKRYIEEL